MQSLILALSSFAHWFGIDASHTSHREKWVASLGALLGIVAVFAVSQHYLGAHAGIFMLASMGASAVLLFAVPHGALSQPWSVLAGHLVSAAIGVSCYRWLPHSVWAAAIAVGLAVGAMAYLRCVHPPGGATALAAVIGGPEIHELGFSYLLFPVAINVAVILGLALAFNNLFPWRRYPIALMNRSRDVPGQSGRLQLSHEDFSAAMLSLDTYVDVTSEELAALFEKACEHARSHSPGPGIRGGAYYSNGALGADWAVRQVIDLPDSLQGPKVQLIYKNVAGADLYEVGVCRLSAFRRWVAFEVEQRDSRWVRKRT
ncbi:HPP family [Spongiibacter sp. IMCC21906]|uniref:HPP family protein n=1 Tax=Spongiibacter sp. IMCC21906 TaxID=1620392 RepID=UPI00062DEC93|nr:HPP family protein [Spongiibacter sp. IMCC21906]AKH67749.1 HPP family [Spongiibacter sp. IMCC21906]